MAGHAACTGRMRSSGQAQPGSSVGLVFTARPGIKALVLAQWVGGPTRSPCVLSASQQLFPPQGAWWL